MTADLRLALVYVCFLLSGFAALVYQTAWTRQLAFVFGTSELAVATVLAAYMAGLGLGAAAAARWASRVRRPVRAYALLELGIALAAVFAVPVAIATARALFTSVLGDEGAIHDEGGLAPTLFYSIASFAIVLIPTGLMGATLPLLARYAVRTEDQIADRVGSLYAINTVGAVAGALCSGFLLLPSLGLGDTILFAAACNGLVFLAAAGLSQNADVGDPPTAESKPAVAGRWILPLIAVSGCVSFTYEVLWTRLLGHVMGGSVYAFSTMLASFLSGIALGAWLAARFAKTPRGAGLAFAVVQLGIAALSVAAFLGVDAIPELARNLGRTGGARLAADAVASGLTLLPASLCIGATFPLAVRILCLDAKDAGPGSARVYAWNTAGAIVGALGAGFFLLPAIGFSGTLVAAAGVNLVLAAAAGFLTSPRSTGSLALCGVAIVALAGLVLVGTPPPWNLLRASPLNWVPTPGPVTYYGVGRSAAVLLVERDGGWQLRTNGLPESSISAEGRRASQNTEARWMAALPTLARPDAKRQLVVGLGGGVVLENVPANIEAIDVVELEPEVVRANRAVSSGRAVDPLADPRVRLVMNDARGALARTSERYDAIISQPSHPWTTGASHLYTREFFELAREHLNPDGVLVQWMGLRFVDDRLVKSLVATLGAVFEHVEVYEPNPEGLLFVASMQPLALRQTAPEAVARQPEIADWLGLYALEEIDVVRVLDNAGSHRYAQGAEVITDDRNLLLMHSPAIARSGGPPFATAGPFDAFDPLLGEDPDRDRFYTIRRLLTRGLHARASAWVQSWPEGTDRVIGQALIDIKITDGTSATRRLAEVVEQFPDEHEARAALLETWRSAVVAKIPRAAGIADGAAGGTREIVLGWDDEEAEDWPALRSRDSRLAAIPASAPEAAEALRLRVEWRLAIGDEDEALSALPLADQMVTLAPTARNLLVRVRAIQRTGAVRGTFEALYELAHHLSPGRTLDQVLTRQALGILATLPKNDPEAQAAFYHPRLEARLRSLLNRRSWKDPVGAFSANPVGPGG